MKQSQIGIEYLMVIGIVLTFLLIFFSYFSVKAMNSLKESEAAEAISSISRAVDFVYSMGSGSETYVIVKIPGGVEESHIGENEVYIKLRIFGGVADMYKSTKAKVIGIIPITKGVHTIRIKHLSSGIVLVGDLCPWESLFYTKLDGAFDEGSETFGASKGTSVTYLRIPMETEEEMTGAWLSVSPRE